MVPSSHLNQGPPYPCPSVSPPQWYPPSARQENGREVGGCVLGRPGGTCDSGDAGYWQGRLSSRGNFPRHARSSGGATRWARREGDRHHGHGGGLGGLGGRDGRKRNVGQGTDPEVILLFARGASILHGNASGANLLAREAVVG